MPVKLMIKSAAQCVEDFALTCEMTWTIAEVKNQISVLYPNKPKREQQKLIYGGKLLPDDLTLKSILNQVQDVYVMHLVCPLPPAPESEKKTANKGNSIPPVYTAPPPLNPNNVYGQMNQPLLTSSDLSGGMPPFANAFTAYPGPDATRQYFAMQQMYTQLMTQYFAQYNSNMSYGPTPSATPTVQQPQNNVPPQNAAPNVIPRQPEEEEDYIDYLYAFARVFILFTLLLYYSSVTRVMAVTLMIVLITMFVRISRRHQREQMLRANARRAAEIAAQQRTDESQSAENDVSEDSPNSDSSATETPAPTPSPPSVPSTIINLVTAFFSSLIPSDPMPLNVN